MPLDPLSMGITGAIGLAQGITGALSDQKQQKYNKDQLDKLLGRQKAGNLGLTGEQRSLLDQQLNAPVAAAASQQRSRDEAIQAGMGQGSGADLSRLRVEQGRTVAGAAQNAATQIAAADQQAKLAQRNEIEQRLGLQSQMRGNDYNQVFGALAQAANPMGQLSASGTAPLQTATAPAGPMGAGSLGGVAGAQGAAGAVQVGGGGGSALTPEQWQKILALAGAA